MRNETSTKFKTVATKRLTEEIADQIECLILNKELKVGDGLPAERDLAAQLKVSRNILREAISMLTQKGLLEVRRGSGTFVARPSVEYLRDTLGFYMRFTSSALLDLLEARRSMEVEIAGLAADRSKQDDHEILFQCIDEMERSIDTPSAYIEADIRFHETLAKASHNQILRLLIGSIRGALRENIRFLLENDPTIMKESINSHRQIAVAVQIHDRGGARKAMHDHLESLINSLNDLQEQAKERADG
jgi:GntR family transcriptional repressor for pyruvate dehydrogenase complex